MRRIAAIVPAMLLVVFVGTSIAWPIAGGRQDQGRMTQIAWSGGDAWRAEIALTSDVVQGLRARESQAPRAHEAQAPRSEDVQAPRAEDTQAPRACQARQPRWRED